jgi:hypothetical protein
MVVREQRKMGQKGGWNQAETGQGWDFAWMMPGTRYLSLWVLLYDTRL